MLTFMTRYLSVFWTPPFSNLWSFIFKIFYITSSIYILFQLRLFPRSREQERGWRLGGLALLGSTVAAYPITVIAKKTWAPSFSAVLVVFSLVLEAFCILPQLLLLRQTKVPTVIDSYYLVALGSYRALYILNWIQRGVSDDVKPEAVPIIFGVVQTLLYLDFAWVYYTRQRVKLRGGHVVDGDDLSKSWVLSRVLGQRDSGSLDEERPRARGGYQGIDDDDDYEARTAGGGAARGGASSWGARGISVSADDDVLADLERNSSESPISADSTLRDPDELALGDSDDETPAVVPKGIKGGDEWRNGKSRSND